MNVFVLCTGRCGSMSFVQAASHIRNYSAAHESRCAELGPARFDYPPRHIEADNRLSWLLGRLDQHFGDAALYVHLVRDPQAVAESFVRRMDRGIMKAYRNDGILMGLPAGADPLAVAHDYVDTVTRNIEAFLRHRPLVMRIELENAVADFPAFCERIGADVDLPSALAEFATRHNASPAASSG